MERVVGLVEQVEIVVKGVMRSVVYKFRLNNAGVSLVELMVSVGVSVTILLVVSQYFADQTKSLRSVTQLLETQAIQQDITRIYGNGTNCTTFFALKDGNTLATLPNLQDSNGTIRYAAGQTYATGTLRLDNIFLVPVPPISLPNKRGQFMIRLEFSRTGSTSIQPRIVSNIPIFFKSNSGNMIQECTTNRQIIQAGLDCVRPTNPPANLPPQPAGNGFNRKVGCPSGYEVVGGGMQDADICKCGLINTVIKPGVDPLFPNGGWECQEQTNAGLTCYAICCRPAP